MIKPFLILQLRPEDAAADNELDAFIRFGGLEPHNVERIRMEKEGVPNVNLDKYSAIIIGGGPSNVSDHEEAKSSAQKRFERELDLLLDEVITRDFPLLGACYGLGAIAQNAGGTVSKERYGEDVGAIDIRLTKEASDDPLTAGLPTSFKAFGGHKEACQDVPPGASLLASSDACPVQMIRIKKNIYATQFHTELDQPGLALRIKIYKDAGYFPPEDMDKLINATKDEIVTVPEKILRRFTECYQAQK